MNIALIAHDKKKELMVQFCIAYCGILSKHRVCATATTGKLVADTTGLDVYCFMSGQRGGDQQQIGLRAADQKMHLRLWRAAHLPNALGRGAAICVHAIARGRSQVDGLQSL